MNRATKITIAMVATLVLAGITLFIGYGVGAARSYGPLERRGYWEQLARLDYESLADQKRGEACLTTGTYVFEQEFPGRTKQSLLIELKVDEGQLTNPPNPDLQRYVVHGLKMQGPAVFWTRSDPDEKPPAYYVGAIDRQGWVGRVYVDRGSGWHDNLPSEVGVWRIRRAEDESASSAKVRHDGKVSARR